MQVREFRSLFVDVPEFENASQDARCDRSNRSSIGVQSSLFFSANSASRR
jgi:hypothetical protein